MTMDYKLIIQKVYQERLKSDPLHSRKKFAQDLKISSSTLSELLNSKHVPSITVIRKIASGLGLTNQETEHLVDLTLLVSPYGRDSREKAFARIKNRQKTLIIV